MWNITLTFTSDCDILHECAAQRGLSSVILYIRHHSWRVMIIGGAICTQLLQQVVNSTK